jgi:hypothetical protein
VALTVGRRPLGWSRRPGERALNFLELGMAVDREERHLSATTRPALERPAIEWRAVGVRRLEQSEGHGAAVAARVWDIDHKLQAEIARPII